MSEKFRQMGGELYVNADAVKESNKAFMASSRHFGTQA
jgi:hypothetical protein